MSHLEDNKLEQSVSHDEGALDRKDGRVVQDAVAGEYINSNVHIDEAENKRLRRKIYKHLLPVMCVAYVTQSLDKGTLGTSSIMGWQEHVGAAGQDYALTSTFLWVGIIAGEPIVNQMVRKFPVAKVLGYSMIVWSGLVLGLAFCLNVKPVFAIRALLGFFESSFSPCLVAITVQWFTQEEQTLVITIFQAFFGLAGAIANLLGFGFYHVVGKDPLYGWQWMTVCIALISFVATAIVLIFLPDTPVQAKWATEEEKVLFIERVRKNEQGIKQKKWKSDQAREAFTDPFTWLLFFMMFSQSLVVGGLNTFNSLLINRAFNFTVTTSLLVSIPLSVFQVILYFFIGWLGTKTKQTIYCMVGYTVVNIVGSVVLITVAPGGNTKGGLLVAFYIMQCFQAVNPSMYAMVSRNVAGQTKKSIVYAIFFVAWATGNAIGPQIFQAAWKPRYINSLYIHIGLYGFFIADILLMRLLLSRRNKKRNEEAQGNVTHENAFDDMTDMQNRDMRYCY